MLCGKSFTSYYSMNSVLRGLLVVINVDDCYLNVSSKRFLLSMVEFKSDAPLKILIEDVRYFDKFQDSWIYKINGGNLSINVNRIIVQGEIIKTAGFSNEIIILDDGSGKAKVTRAAQVPGDLSWVSAGVHCSVVGTLLDNGKLPLIHAEKIAQITNQVLLEMWALEVKELRDVMANKAFPKLMEDSGCVSKEHF